MGMHWHGKGIYAIWLPAVMYKDFVENALLVNYVFDENVHVLEHSEYALTRHVTYPVYKVLSQ